MIDTLYEGKIREEDYICYLKFLINRVFKIMPLKQELLKELDIDKKSNMENSLDVYTTSIIEEILSTRELLVKPIGLELVFNIQATKIIDDSSKIRSQIFKCVSIIETYIKLLEVESNEL